MGAKVMGNKRNNSGNSGNNAKKTRQQGSSKGNERKEDAGASLDNKSRNAAADRFDRDVAHSTHSGQEEARAKSRDR
ncbi:MAG TPA: hypothetical protein VFC19_22685 [Candidatus Limnocylindrales bacterium]|nr:hypothetical protein [Candidatus Limnocylindrales bacterium]